MMPNTPIMAVKREKSIFYGIKIMPPMRYMPRHKKAVFGMVQRRTMLKLRCFIAVFLYASWGASHTVTSRDFVCHRSPNHSRKRLNIWGRSPQSPKERNVMLWGKIYELPSA